MTRPSATRPATKPRRLARLLPVLAIALGPASAAHALVAADTLLAHFESECLDGGGCLQSINSGTQVEFGFDIFPDETLIATLNEAETVDVTIAAPGYLNDYLTSGSLTAPEPLFFNESIVGAGGSGRQVSKADLRDGFFFLNDVLRVEYAYDVPLANGIDLQGTAEATEVRLQVFLVDLPDSTLGGSALRTNYRVEIHGVLIPEPSSALLVGLATAAYAARRRR